MVKKGERIGGFYIEAVEELPQRNGVGITARHERTGLEVFHFLTDDKENFFGFAVSTPPQDDSGVSHILEHCVLAGSQTVAMKDAFFAMDKRSVATFMNAMTYPDLTLYPAASVVPLDYYNLLEYYGDCVFFPLLTENTFKTEGIRLERDENGAPVFNGIVYNEMKGVYSQFEAAAEQAAISLLFPDNGYRFEYGGDPNAIPSLSYEAFLDFYRRCYVPQNVKLFLCGSLPTEDQLQFLEEKLLSRIAVSGNRSVMPLQTRWQQSRAFAVEAPAGEEGATVAVSWLWDEADSAQACIEAELLSSCLCGHQGTPLYQKLIHCGYGADLAPYMGGGSELRQLFFTCGLRGVEKTDVEAARRAILKAVEEIAEEGIASEVIDGILDSYEFSLREIKGGVPLGLRYMERMMFTWVRGGDPYEWFRSDELFVRIRKRFSDPEWIKNVLRRLLTQNSHRADITVSSSDDYFQKWSRSAAEAASHLMRTRFAQPETLTAAIERFLSFQNEPENEEALNRFPSLTRQDVEAPLATVDFQIEMLDSCRLLLTENRTNGIVYLDFYFCADGLEPEDLPVINAFSKLLLSAGQKNRSYDEVAREATAVFGHISSFTEIGNEVRSLQPHLYVIVRSCFLEEKIDEAISSLKKMFSQTVFSDRKRIREALTESKNDLFADFTQSGTHYAATVARSFLFAADAAVDTVDGLAQYRFLSRILKTKGGIDRFSRHLEALYSKICSKNQVFYALSGEKEGLAKVKSRLPEIHAVLSEVSLSKETRVFDQSLAEVPKDLLGVALPSDVAFNAWVKKADEIESPHYCPQRILAEILKTRLLDEIRVRSGAYGASAALKGGCLQMTSYRDPQLLPTFEVFHSALQQLAQNPPSVAETENQIIRFLADNLKPLRPSGKLLKATLHFLYGMDDSLRERIFKQTAAVTAESICEEAKRLSASDEQEVGVSLAGKKALKKAKVALSDLSLV